MKQVFKAIREWLLLVLVALVLLQVFFIGRVAWMAVSNPSSTAFERSQAWQIFRKKANSSGVKIGDLPIKFLSI